MGPTNLINKGHLTQKWPFGTKSSGLVIKDCLKIEGCKIEGLLATTEQNDEGNKQ